MLRSARLSRWFPFLLALVAAGYRLFLSTRYYGWEESDYGNLAMTRGVLESGFLDYDMRHLPFYYFVSAVVLAAVGDTVVATHLVSLVSGTCAVVLAYLIARRAFDETTGRITGALLCFQPEFALYAASSLRDPLFTCLALTGCYLLLNGAPRKAAVSTGFSFLTRFDSLGTNIPAMLIHLARRPPRLFSSRHPLWTALIIVAGFVGAWSYYCGQVHGTYIFFGQTVQMNVATGEAREAVGLLPFLRNGLLTSLGMFFQTLPLHLGPVFWGTTLAGLVLHRRELLARTNRGTLFTYLATNTIFWLMVGFAAQHAPTHNLYWIWMYTLTSFWAMFSASFLSYVAGLVSGKTGLSAVTLLVSIAAIGVPFWNQTRYQLEQSEQLYKPQVELAEWVEANVPAGATLIFDNIPERYVNRRPHEWRFISWYDVPVPPGDAIQMGNYLSNEAISYVLWFKEDWTQAPTIAPYLAELRDHSLGAVRLHPLFHEEQYGFIFYQVLDGGGAP